MLESSLPLTDPSAADPLGVAARWIQELALGTAATVIAVIAVASVGFLMLSGRVAVRRSLTAVLGCFVLFGAPAISAGLLSLARPSEARRDPQTDTTPSPLPPDVHLTPLADPNAGATPPR